MWADGVFGSRIDAALMTAALCLCAGAVWMVARRLGRPRFPGAIDILWLLATVTLPIPTYFACGAGLWTGAILFEALGLGTSVGAAVGWVIAPPLVCASILSALAAALTKPPQHGASPTAPAARP